MDNMNTATVVPWTYQGKQLRTITLNGDPYWCASDVCNILGYANGRKAIQDNCKEKGVTTSDTPTNGGIQTLTYIDESNLYRLIMRSKLPEAEKFQDWVHDEVLPQIRKTGSYSSKPAIFIPEDPRDQVIMLCDKLKEMTLECKHLITKIVEKDEIIKDQAPKVALAEACIVSTGLQTLTETAKVLKVHPNLFIQYLKQIGILYKEDKNNLPIDKYAKNGYFEVKEFVFSGKPGTIHKRLQTYVTGKGLELLKRVVDGLPCDSKIRSEFTRRNEVTV